MNEFQYKNDEYSVRYRFVILEIKHKSQELAKRNSVAQFSSVLVTGRQRPTVALAGTLRISDKAQRARNTEVPQ